MNPYRIAILEEDPFVDDVLKRNLQRQGHTVVGTAPSYEKATELYSTQATDIWLLAIPSQGPKTGIKVAHFLRSQSRPAPFIFLSSQLDSQSLEGAKETFPAGYLSTPVQEGSLLATIEIAMHTHQNRRKKTSFLEISEGTTHFRIPVKDILYLQADHVYVQIHVKERRPILKRCSLREIFNKLPKDQFIQTHRSYVINKDHISQWDPQCLYLENKQIPISRSRKKAVSAQLTLN